MKPAELFVLHAVLPFCIALVVFSVNLSIAAEPKAVTFSVDDLVLHGDLSKPDSGGPFPAVIWSHGAEGRRPGLAFSLGELFARRGYVLLIPHMRGHGRSPRHSLVDQFRTENDIKVRNIVQLQLIDLHMRDLVGAVQYLEKLPIIDRNRIGILGCSFGGSLTVFAAREPNLRIRAAVDFAGAAFTWKQSPELRQRLIGAIREANVPIFFIQAENDFDLDPSRILSQELERLKKPHQLKIYPMHGLTAREGHRFCTTGSKIWEDDVFAFLDKAMQ